MCVKVAPDFFNLSFYNWIFSFSFRIHFFCWSYLNFFFLLSSLWYDALEFHFLLHIPTPHSHATYTKSWTPSPVATLNIKAAIPNSPPCVNTHQPVKIDLVPLGCNQRTNRHINSQNRNLSVTEKNIEYHSPRRHDLSFNVMVDWELITRGLKIQHSTFIAFR